MDRDPLLWNKILGAVLGALLIGTLSAFAANLLYGEEHASSDEGAEEVPLALVDVESDSAEDAPAGSVEPSVPFADLLAHADVARGKKISRKCAACHTFTSGGANRIGPNLWSVAGRTVASTAGFKYSKAMKNFGGAWSNARLDAFLRKPKEAVAGTKMNFVGLKKAQDRANIVAWLQTLK